MGVTASRALGAMLVFALGVAAGIGVDRALVVRSPDRRTAADTPVRVEENEASAPGIEGEAPGPLAPRTLSLEQTEASIRELLEGSYSPGRMRSIDVVCRLLPIEDLPDAFRRVGRLLRREPEGEEVLRALAARWVREDPEAALSAAQDVRGEFRDPLLCGIMEELARMDPGKAKDLLSTIPPSSLGDRVTNHFAAAWAERDPASAVAWVKELPRGRSQTWALQGVIGAWSRWNPEDAAAHVERLPLRERYHVSNVAGIWAKKDPSAASAWALGLPAGPIRSQAMVSMVSAWARDDPQTAWTLLSSLEPGLLPQDRATAIASIAAGMAKVDAERTLGWLEELPPGHISNDARFSICMNLLGTSPESAASVLGELHPGPSRTMAVSRIASFWASVDTEAALGWVERLVGDEKNLALQEAARVWAESDVMAAVDHVRALPQSSARDGILAELLPRLASVDPERGVALIDHLSVDVRESAALGLVREWSLADPPGAAVWAETFPEGSLRHSALAAVAGVWTTYDPAGVESWITRLPAGESRDAALAAFIDGKAAQDPAAAAVWAERIEEPSERIIRLESVARSWLASDPARARHWISNSPLPDDMKTQLLDPGL